MPATAVRDVGEAPVASVASEALQTPLRPGWKRSLSVFAACFVVYLAVLEGFLAVPQFNDIVQIRPASALGPVLGLFFGLPGVFGCATANLVSDILHEGATPFMLAGYFVIQVMYNGLPRWVWYLVNARSPRPYPRFDSASKTALYMALQKKSARSMILFGMALSFKLQTVFFLPALLTLWLRKDIKLRHLALIPAAYMAMMIPAFWGGKSLHHALTVYTAQASTYNFMTVNGPSLYNFLPASMDKGTLYTMFSGMAMALGMAMLAIVCLMVCLHREHITREGTLLTCLLVLGGVPFFLPKMHERYTFGADVLALAIAAYNPKRVWLPLLFGLSSYICYTAGLPGDAIFDLKWATVFQGAAVALTAAALYRSLNEEKAEAALAEVKA